MLHGLGPPVSHGRIQRGEGGLAPHLLTETLINGLIEHAQLLGSAPDLTTLASLGTIHHDLAAALAAARQGVSGGADAWLSLRERTAQAALHACPRDIAARIRFRSHEWSNHLHALAELHHDEDLGLLAEDFCLDSRIMVAATVRAELPPECLVLGTGLLACYQAGGWPCGWTGHFPAGAFEIFVRPRAA